MSLYLLFPWVLIWLDFFVRGLSLELIRLETFVICKQTKYVNFHQICQYLHIRNHLVAYRLLVLVCWTSFPIDLLHRYQMLGPLLSDTLC